MVWGPKMKLQKQMINNKIIFDNHTKRFMTKIKMIKLAKSFWKQELRDDEKKEYEKSLKEECGDLNKDFNKEYLKMKIDYLFSQFNEHMSDWETSKLITPFYVWDGSDRETWELVEMPQQIFGIWIEDDGEDRIKRIKEMIKWHEKAK